MVPDANRQQTWHLLSFALKSAEAWPATRALLLALAPKLEMAGFRENWIPYLATGCQVAQQQDDGEVVAECELQLGMLYRLQSRYAEAQRWTEASVAHFAAHANDTSQARALNELAWLEQLEGRYDAATDHVEQALALLPADDPQWAMSYRVQGMIAMGQRQWQTAEQLHRKALQLFQQAGDRRGTAWSQQNLGYALSEQAKPEAAILLYEQAAATLQQLADHYHWAIVQMNLGVAYYRQEQAAIACSRHLAAAKVFAQIDDTLNRANAETNLGLCYLMLDRYAESRAAFERAIHLYKILHNEVWTINAMDGLAMTLIASKRYTEAVAAIEHAQSRLVKIEKSSYYENLSDKLNGHLAEALLGQSQSRVNSNPNNG